MKKLLALMTIITTLIFCNEEKLRAQTVNLSIVSDSIHIEGDPDITYISVTIQNSGDTISSLTYIAYYANIDSHELSTTDSTLIWAQVVPPIQPNTTITIDTSINLCNPVIVNALPMTLQFGFGFYIGYDIDAGDLNDEEDESDNTGVNTEVINLLCAVGIEESAHTSWEVYPNPASDFISVQVPVVAEKNEIFIYNSSGERVFYSVIKSYSENIPVSFLSPGVYWIEWNGMRKKLIRQ